MNAYLIILKSGASATVYTPSTILIADDTNKGCPIKRYCREEGILEIDATLNSKNELKWRTEQKQLIKEGRELDEGIMKRIYATALQQVRSEMSTNLVVPGQ